ncbi:MAG: 4-hydroxy-3-methylbut-2-enyl diphosphate reductase [Bacilli bacterium]|nr:4-hydroxy-3-methylbut-2-enyl diphosphate reductase [Bacilli bacterium]
MKIECGKLCGFCSGVNYTINKALEVLSNEDDIYCLGQIVHNERVIKSLEEKGMVTVNNIDDVPDNSKLIIRAHGEVKDVFFAAKKRNIEIIDLTCGKIKVILKKIEKEMDKSFIIIIGKKNHPETIGTLSYAGDNSSVVEDEDDILITNEKLKKSRLSRVYIVSQTTFSSRKFDELITKIKNVFDCNIDIVVDKTICDVTEKRQKEVFELSSRVDKMIIIGGKNSSNTKELAKISKNNCDQSFLVQTKEDLKNIVFSSEDNVGIMAGASTPREIIDEVIDYLNTLY